MASDLEQVHFTRLTGYTGVACAVLWRAAKDLVGGNGYSREARSFLRSPGCEEMLAGLLDTLAPQDPDPGIDTLDQAHEMLASLLARYVGGS